jgi:hypothetical protein
MSFVGCCRFSVSADTAVVIFRVNVYWGFRKTYIGQAVGGEWHVKDLIVRIEKWAAIQSVMSTWLRKRGYEKSFLRTTW